MKLKSQKAFRTYAVQVLVVGLISILGSCGSSKVNNSSIYFRTGADTVALKLQPLQIQRNDQLNIQVFSQTSNQQQAAVFNLTLLESKELPAYVVSDDGYLDLPLIGSFRVVGLTIEEARAILVIKIGEYVKNPTVIVRLLNFNVNVLGEVRLPGIHRFNAPSVNILDAISSAGDITDYGERNKVTVIREQENKKIYYTVDLGKKDLFTSPVYYLQPHDIVYVSPNKNKLSTLNVNPESQRKTGLLITITSLVLSLGTFIITAFK